jgi:hypothetical protein
MALPNSLSLVNRQSYEKPLQDGKKQGGLNYYAIANKDIFDDDGNDDDDN